MAAEPTSRRLTPVLIESVDLARDRWGPDSELTAGGDIPVGLLLIHLGEYPRAEPYCREETAFRIKHEPDGPGTIRG